MPNVFDRLANRIEKISPNEVLFNIFQDEFVIDWILETIKDRITDEGMDKYGNQLITDRAKDGFTSAGAYAFLTEEIKWAKGQVVDIVTLQDTGDFFESWKGKAQKKRAKLSANFKKGGAHIGDNFITTYGATKGFEAAILAMTDEEFQILTDKIIKPRFIQYYKSNVLR